MITALPKHLLIQPGGWGVRALPIEATQYSHGWRKDTPPGWDQRRSDIRPRSSDRSNDHNRCTSIIHPSSIIIHHHPSYIAPVWGQHTKQIRTWDDLGTTKTSPVDLHLLPSHITPPIPQSLTKITRPKQKDDQMSTQVDPTHLPIQRWTSWTEQPTKSTKSTNELKCCARSPIIVPATRHFDDVILLGAAPWHEERAPHHAIIVAP